MKTLIAVLIIASLVQSTILPIDLALLILICRSYIRPDKANLFLAFGFGLLTGHLNSNLLGLSSLIYLMIISITESLSISGLASNSFLIVPLCLFLMIINQIIPSFVVQQTIQLFPRVLIESILSLPVLYLVRFWEERFIIRDSRLKF